MKTFKTIKTAIAVTAIAAVSTLSAQGMGGSPPNSLDIKVGAAYSLDESVDKGGFDSALAYNIALDPFFAIAPEIGFYWLSYDVDGDDYGLANKEKVNRDIYTFPVMFNFKIMIPMGNNDGFSGPSVKPYVNIGAGWVYSVAQIEGVADQTADGVAAQAIVGAAFPLSSGGDFGQKSSVEVIAEAGYRYLEPETTIDGTTVASKLSGVVVRTGIRYAF